MCTSSDPWQSSRARSPSRILRWHAGLTTLHLKNLPGLIHMPRWRRRPRHGSAQRKASDVHLMQSSPRLTAVWSHGSKPFIRMLRMLRMLMPRMPIFSGQLDIKAHQVTLPFRTGLSHFLYVFYHWHGKETRQERQKIAQLANSVKWASNHPFHLQIHMFSQGFTRLCISWYHDDILWCYMITKHESYL